MIMRVKERMTKTSKSCWTAFERTVSRFFGSERTALSGSNSKQTASDSLHPVLFIEAKLRKRMWIWNLFTKTEKLAAKENKIPVVAIKQKGCKGWLLVIRADVNDLESVFWESLGAKE